MRTIRVTILSAAVSLSAIGAATALCAEAGCLPEIERAKCRQWIEERWSENDGNGNPIGERGAPFPIDMPLPWLEKDNYDWFARHESRVELAKTVNPQIVFIGDSITHGWEANDRRGDAKGTFDCWFGKYATLNLGFGWDRIQNVLWRLEHGEMDGTNPKVVVIHIGTNNTAPGYKYNAAPNPPAEVADGILAVCRKVRGLAPNARIVLMKVFPRGKTPEDPYRGKVAAVNAELDRKLADFHDDKLTVLDMYDKFVDKDGNISLDLTIDYLHPTAKGYDLWAEAIAPIVEAECAALQRPVSRSACTQPTGELQEKAQALADLAVKEGMQGALQFCAFKDGKCIVDVWAGTMTTNAGAAKIDGDTLFPIFSTEKPMLATAVHRSAEQGKLEYDRPVSDYWPEFRGAGKERLTPRLLLAYRSGLPDVKQGMKWDSLSELADWKGMLDWYASCEPEIEPGTKQRYMPRSYGWALGGLLEKAWERSANDILREQVLAPAGIEHDFYFVCGDGEIGRIATAYRSEVFETMNSDIARRSLLPSAWAVSSARGIAKFYNRLCGFDGKPPLVKKETLDEALKPCRHESDPVPDAEGLKKWHLVFGMGYGLWGEADDISRVFGHGGVGGSEGLCDRSQRLAVGYTCNFENAPPKLREAFYSLVGIRWRYWKEDVNIQDLQMSTVSE